MTDSSSPVRVFVLPFYAENPYQSYLHAHIEKQGNFVITPLLSHNQIRGIKFRRGDVVHLHWPIPFKRKLKSVVALVRLLGSLWRARREGARLIWTIHNLTPHDSQDVAIDLFFCRRLASLAHRLICHSDNAKTEVVETYGVAPEKVAVIHHPNYIGVYPATISRDDARKKLGIPATKRVVLFLGQLRPYKGVDLLVQAFSQVSGDDLCLVLAGRPDRAFNESPVRQSISRDPRILLHPRFIDDGEIQDFMHAADIVAFPYKKAFTSGAMLLAMSFHKACLAFDHPFSMFLLNDSNSILVPANSANGLAEALEKLPSLSALAEMGRKSRLRAEEFTWQEAGQRTAQLYRS